MTGIEWEVCDDPARMVRAVNRRGGTSDRKWRLFLAEFWRWQAERLGTNVVSTSPARQASADELYGRATDMEHWAEVGKLPRGQRPSRSGSVVFFNRNAFEAVCRTVEAPIWIGGRSDAMIRQCEILRDLLGNPFRKPPFDHRWLTTDVTGLARGIYEDRGYDRLPILSDALLDAGCEDERIIAHCRSSMSHVRGCWLIDLLIQKS